MRMAEKLERADLDEALAGLDGWTFDESSEAIGRHFRFRNFSEAFGFMARVALAAEAMGHHPDWSNTYDKVSIALSTHDAGGVTQKDIELAGRISRLAAK
jgi:4a-hydroxytetrahydrobiopterin dehydratase